MKELAVATRISTPSPGGIPYELAEPRLSEDFEARAHAKKAPRTVPVPKPVQQSEEVKRWQREMVRFAYNLSRRKR
jgi:hypothetical protein